MSLLWDLEIPPVAPAPSKQTRATSTSTISKEERQATRATSKRTRAPDLPARAASKQKQTRDTSSASKTKIPTKRAMSRKLKLSLPPLRTMVEPAPVLERPPAKLRLGSDFSGLGMDMLALHFLGVPFEVSFSSEVDRKKVAMLSAIASLVGVPHPCFEDVCERDLAAVASCDVYIAGPPCCSWSSAGLGRGLSDCRGAMLPKCIDYVRARLPRVVIIENVSGLRFQKHKPVLLEVIQRLKELQYKVHARLLNSRDHGIPQNRRRVYIVGVRGEKERFRWPPRIGTLPLRAILDTKTINADHSTLSKGGQITLKKWQHKIGEHKLDSGWYVIDAGASERFSSCLEGVTPCLTRARSVGHYVPKLRRFLTMVEAGRLQGLPAFITRALMASQGGNERPVRQALGDAMSLNVLMRVLLSALASAGLLARVPEDMWAAGVEGAQMATKLIEDGVMPDLFFQKLLG